MCVCVCVCLSIYVNNLFWLRVNVDKFAPVSIGIISERVLSAAGRCLSIRSIPIMSTDVDCRSARSDEKDESSNGLQSAYNTDNGGLRMHSVIHTFTRIYVFNFYLFLRISNA